MTKETQDDQGKEAPPAVETESFWPSELEVDREARSLTVATFSTHPYRPKTEGWRKCRDISWRTNRPDRQLRFSHVSGWSFRTDYDRLGRRCFLGRHPSCFVELSCLSRMATWGILFGHFRVLELSSFEWAAIYFKPAKWNPVYKVWRMGKLIVGREATIGRCVSDSCMSCSCLAVSVPLLWETATTLRKHIYQHQGKLILLIWRRKTAAKCFVCQFPVIRITFPSWSVQPWFCSGNAAFLGTKVYSCNQSLFCSTI